MIMTEGKWVLPYHGKVDRIMPVSSLFHGNSKDNVDEFHVRISLPRIPSCERPISPDN